MVGGACLVTGRTECHADGMILGPARTTTTVDHRTPTTACSCCGAPHDPNRERCRYCDTVYRASSEPVARGRAAPVFG